MLPESGLALQELQRGAPARRHERHLVLAWVKGLGSRDLEGKAKGLGIQGLGLRVQDLGN